MSNVNQATESGGDDVVWFVQVSPSQMRVMTLDELDDAFQRGRIDEHTLVREDGESHWAALGNVAGLESASEKAPESVSLRPVVSHLSDLDFDPAPPLRSRRGLVFTAAALAVVVGGIAFGATKLSRAPHASAPAAIAAAAPAKPAVTIAIPPPPVAPQVVTVVAPLTKATTPAIAASPKKAVAPKKAKKPKR